MKKHWKVLAALATVALASGAVLARDTMNIPKVKPGQAYPRGLGYRGVTERLVGLPNVDPGPGVSSAAVKSGPVALMSPASAGASNESLPKLGGSAIPGMRGGAVLSPMERTGQEIRRAIRRLG